MLETLTKSALARKLEKYFSAKWGYAHVINERDYTKAELIEMCIHRGISAC